MIDLYTWGTPNGRKVSIMLEEIRLKYRVHEVNIGKGDQHHPDFLSISPNNKIPCIVDSSGPDGSPFSVFESGAILIYLAEKVSSDLMPSNPVKRAITLQWLMFQMASVGPMFGQAHHFLRNPKEIVPYGQNRYRDETNRLYAVMDDHFENSEYLSGDDYTIADIATYPWVARFEWHQIELEEYENVKNWFDRVGERDAVKRGMSVPFLN